MKLIRLSVLTPRRRAQLDDLFRLCREAEPVRLSFPLPPAGEVLADECFFLLCEHGEAVCAAHLFYPDGQTGELIGFTRPGRRRQGHFRRLLASVRRYAGALGLERIYLISDGLSPDADAALAALGLLPEYSEYLLEKALPDPSSLSNDAAKDPRITVSEVAADRLPDAFFAEIFPQEADELAAYLEEIRSDRQIHSFLLTLDGRPAGQVQATLLGETAYLSGFGIIPSCRGQGLGHYFLRELETVLASRSVRQCTLQVSGRNPRALEFYHATGWRALEELRYFPLTL